jgi:hypothetical protein
MESLADFMVATGLRKKSIRIDLALFFFIAMNLSWFGAEAYGETFVGKAVNAKGIVEYVEYHTVKYENGKVSESQTIYYDANNKKIGELISEYSFGPQFGSYDFRDIRAQYQEFIVHNLEQIAQGEVFHIQLVLPSRLDQYEFRIRKRKINGDTLYIRLEIDNWLLRMFAPHVDAEYDLRTRHLLRYEGVSNLEDTSGKHKKVTITYSYES